MRRNQGVNLHLGVQGVRWKSDLLSGWLLIEWLSGGWVGAGGFDLMTLPNGPAPGWLFRTSAGLADERGDAGWSKAVPMQGSQLADRSQEPPNRGKMAECQPLRSVGSSRAHTTAIDFCPLLSVVLGRCRNQAGFPKVDGVNYQCCRSKRRIAVKVEYLCCAAEHCLGLLDYTRWCRSLAGSRVSTAMRWWSGFRRRPIAALSWAVCLR